MQLGREMKQGYKQAMFALTILLPAAAIASETITYGYDAKGRLVKVVRSGTVNNGVITTYTHDKADNRKTIVVTGSANPPS